MMGLDLIHKEEGSKMTYSGFKVLKMSIQACSAMKVIMDDTLDYTKIEAGVFQIAGSPNSLAEMVEHTIFTMTPFANEQKNQVNLSYYIDPKIPLLCLFDKNRVQQIACNLISNAIKFSPHNGEGRVAISLSIVPEG